MERKYYLRHKEEILKKRHDYYLANKEKLNQKKREYYRKNKAKLLQHQKKYNNREEVMLRKQTPEYKAKYAARQKRYRDSEKGRLKRAVYRIEYRKKNPDYWANRYKNKRNEIREKQKEYDSTQGARELKRISAMKPERRAKKSEYTARYQARPDVKEKRLIFSRYYKKTPKGRLTSQISNEKRRARLYQVLHDLKPEEWLEIRAKTNGVCLLCSRNVGIEKMTKDHILPVSKGGGYTSSNIRAICRSCNSKLGNRGYILHYDEPSKKTMKLYG